MRTYRVNVYVLDYSFLIVLFDCDVKKIIQMYVNSEQAT